MGLAYSHRPRGVRPPEDLRRRIHQAVRDRPRGPHTHEEVRRAHRRQVRGGAQSGGLLPDPAHRDILHSRPFRRGHGPRLHRRVLLQGVPSGGYRPVLQGVLRCQGHGVRHTFQEHLRVKPRGLRAPSSFLHQLLINRNPSGTHGPVRRRLQTREGERHPVHQGQSLPLRTALASRIIGQAHGRAMGTGEGGTHG